MELRARQCGRVGIMAVCPYLVDTEHFGRNICRECIIIYIDDIDDTDDIDIIYI